MKLYNDKILKDINQKKFKLNKVTYINYKNVQKLILRAQINIDI